MTLTAADVMTRSVVTARPEDTVGAVAKLLADHAISAVPVCGADGAVLGILSEGDLLRPFGQANAMRRAWWLELLAEGSELAPVFLDYIKLDRHLARELMVAPAITVSEQAGLAEIADLLAQRHIKRVPVMRGKQMVGIVSRADIIGALARMPVPDLAGL